MDAANTEITREIESPTIVWAMSSIAILMLLGAAFALVIAAQSIGKDVEEAVEMAIGLAFTAILMLLGASIVKLLNKIEHHVRPK